EEEIELPVTELDGPLDTPPREDRHDTIARPCRIEAGIVEVQAPLVSQAELGGDDLSVDLEEAGPQRAAGEKPPRDRPQKRPPLLRGEAVLVTPSQIGLGPALV